MLGGVQAVTWTDVKQMAIVVGGLCARWWRCARASLEVGLGKALHIAGAAGTAHDDRFPFRSAPDLHVLVGPLGGLFLHLSYFGCDQSQVQRYLTAKSLKAGATLAAHERVRQDPAAGAGAARRRVHVPVLCISSAADALQRGVRAADRQECAGGRIPSARGGVLEGVRRAPPGGAGHGGRRRRQRASGRAPGFATRRPRFRRFAPALRRLSRTSPPLQATRIPSATRQSRTSTMCFRPS